MVQTFTGGTYNAIDSNFFRDEQGNDWLEFGSYWSGLKMIRLDRRTGKPMPGDDHVWSLAYRPAPEGADNPIEGGFLFRHGDYYYFFASYDYCCRKDASNYFVALWPLEVRHRPVCRSSGAATDARLRQDRADRTAVGTDATAGPGHCGLMHDRTRDLIVYHAWDVEQNSAVLRLAELRWDAQGWPVALI